MAKDRKLYRLRPDAEEQSPRIQIPQELAESIAETAREGYQSEGRGLVIVAVDVEQEQSISMTDQLSINEFYIPVARMRQVRSAIPYLSDDEYEEIIGLVKAYNPIVHFVVLLSMGNSIICYRGEHPIHFVQTA
jgi:hypothetical protein